MILFRYIIIIPFIFLSAAVFAQAKPVMEMSKSDILNLTADELYALPLEDVMMLSEIVGVSVEELYKMVSTSSRTEESIDEAPNVMHVITREDIKYRGYRNLREILINIPGFGVFMKDVQYVAQVRGIAPNDNEKISFMLDGHRINQMAEPDILNSPVNLSNLERIEIIVGPGSVLYGAESLVAIVNMITRKAYNSEISVTGGAPLEFALNGLFGKVWDVDRHISVSFTGMRREGWTAYREGAVETGSAYEAMAKAKSTMPQRMYPSYFLTANGQHGDWSMAMSSFNYASSRIGWAGAISLDEREELRNREYVHSMVVKNEHKFDEKLGSRFIASFDSKKVVQPNNLTMSENSYRAELGLNHTARRHYLQSGVQFGYYQERDLDVLDYADTVYAYVKHLLVPNTNLWSLGVYISGKYGISDKLYLIAALRSDYNSVLGRTRISVNPRIAVTYSPSQKFTGKLMFNTASRYPAVRASHLNVWDQGNPSRRGRMVTRPETLLTVESENTYYGDKTRLSLVAYYQRLNGFIAWFEPFMNVGDFSGWGLEATWKTTFTPDISVWANATYNNTDFTQRASSPTDQDGAVIPTSAVKDDKDKMIAVPRLSGSAGADFRFLSKLHFSPKLNCFTGQPTTDYSHYDPLTGKFDFFYVNCQIYFDAALTCDDIVKGLDLRIAAQNVLNNKHQVGMVFANQTYTPQGTTFQATLFYSF
jgi:iron complex outermembrane receptor protein